MNEVILTQIKLLSVLILSNIFLFYKDAFYLNLIFFLFILFYFSLSQKLSLYISWLKPLFFAVIIIFFIQLLTKESLTVSGLSSIRILSLSSLIFLLIQTTKLSLIVKALSFLPPQISFVLSLGLGMIPQLTKEIKQVIIAQQARGHKTNWNIIKSYLPVLLPLFTKSFIRAEQLSISMQARGFELTKR